MAMWSILAVGFFNSIIFPTIFTLGVAELGPLTGSGSGILNMAIVGGVQVMLSPAAFISFSAAGMLSPDGKCKTFDKGANGYVRGEGCGVVVLKRLADALRDGDTVLALLRGTAVNQDGRTAGITAPNGPSQQQCIRQALARVPFLTLSRR